MPKTTEEIYKLRNEQKAFLFDDYWLSTDEATKRWWSEEELKEAIKKRS